MPERTIWSIPVKPEEEHMIAVAGSGGYYVLVMQKGGQEDEHRKWYYERFRILIVDDEPDIVLTLHKMLLHNGLEHVDTFIDPLLALKNFKPGLYDLAILDIVMPKIDGFELFEKIKQIDNNLKVCFMSAFEVNYQTLRAVFPTAASAEDIGCFIRKPIKAKDLLIRVKAELC
jgi:CheY-like chemotaxis protein